MKTLWSSCNLPSIIGAEPDGENEDKNKDKDLGAGGAGDENKSKDESGSDKGGDPQKKITAQDEIIARKQKALEDQEAELQELRDFKKKQEQEKLSAEELAAEQLKELETKNSNLSSGTQMLTLENEFLKSNKHVWHDPSVALTLADLTEVEVVEKDGKFSLKDPKSLEKALDALAESKPFLLKSNDEDDKEDKKWTGNSGTPPKQKRTSDDANERAKLQKKYPALRNR